MEFKKEGEKLRVLLSGEIDHHTARRICEEIDVELSVTRPKICYLDFSRVSFMDSSGLAIVAGRKRICDRLQIKVYITNLSGYPEKILRLSGAEKFIKILEDEKNEM